MLAEAAGVSKIIIACGRTDLRKGIDGLAQLIGTKYDMNPFEKNVLFLFCGGRGDRIKGLLWEGNGFLLLYKRLEDGSFSWPRTPEEAMQLTREQYEMLMMGLNPLRPKIRDVILKRYFSFVQNRDFFAGIFPMNISLVRFARACDRAPHSSIRAIWINF